MDTDILVFLLVVGLRFIIPLFIIRYPLPAITAALVLDAADQTIFQNFTDLDLDSYQSYDKALDIFYLTIAYLSTIRNWPWSFHQRTATFLWYYRLLGVALFELLQLRPLLLIFPNVFEYFFIAIEVMRTRYNPARLTKKVVLGLAAFIWIFIKLPQETWLHILQLDLTNVMKVDVLGVTVDTSWGDALSQNWWFISLLAIIGVAAYFGLKKLNQTLPQADWPTTFSVDKHLVHKELTQPKHFSINDQLVEKIALITMVLIIFSQIIPNSNPTNLQLLIGAATGVVVTTIVSELLARRNLSPGSRLFGEFLVVLGSNILAAISYNYFLSWGYSANVNTGATLFYILLASIIITLYDRFRHQKVEVAAAS